MGSVEATAPKVFGDDDVCHRVEDELDIAGVRGAGDVGVDLFVSRLVSALILGLDIGYGVCESAGAYREKRMARVREELASGPLGTTPKVGT